MELIGNGIDIVEIKRLKLVVEKWGDLFLNRVFTEKEIEYAKSRRKTYEHLAGRFAAKEAIIKAADVGELGFKDIEIVNKQSGKPYATITKAKSINKKYTISVSISHIKDYAIANAVIAKKN